MIECCIFDLDGTLLNTLKTITHYVNRTLVNHGIEPIGEDDCRRFIGNGAKQLIDSALKFRGAYDENFSQLVLNEYNAAYNENTSYLTVEYEGITEMLKSLAARGVKLGVLSNKPEETTRLAVEKFFPNIFCIVHGGRAGVRLKPHPDALLEMISDMGAEISKVAYIGDTGVDVQTGKAACVGITVGVSWGFRDRDDLVGADVISDSIDALKKVIENA